MLWTTGMSSLRELINYIETFCYVGSRFTNVNWHKLRVVNTLGNETVWRVMAALLEGVELRADGQPVRFTVEYNADGIVGYRAVEYHAKSISRLVPIEADIDYHLKYADRSALESLKCGLAPDEEPLIVKRGLVTDTTFANVVFRARSGVLYTPRTPLLEGTRRAALLDAHILTTADIAPADLNSFTDFYLINAMRTL